MSTFCEAVIFSFLFSEKIVEKHTQDFSIFMKIGLFVSQSQRERKEFQIVLSGFWNNTMIDEIQTQHEQGNAADAEIFNNYVYTL